MNYLASRFGGILFLFLITMFRFANISLLFSETLTYHNMNSICIYIYVNTCTNVHYSSMLRWFIIIYIYIKLYIERKRERERRKRFSSSLSSHSLALSLSPSLFLPLSFSLSLSLSLSLSVSLRIDYINIIIMKERNKYTYT